MHVPTLVVDDQPDIRFLIKVLIDHANEGLVVIGEAANGPEALAQAEQTDPLVVVLDEMMPGMNGLEVAGRLRARKPSQVIILCSAYLDADLIAEARAAGIVHCLAKEDINELPDLIRQVAGAA